MAAVVSGRLARARPEPRASSWLLASLILVVAGLAVGGLILLGQRAETQRAEEKAMLRLDLELERVSSLEWRMVEGNRYVPAARQQLESILTRIRRDLRGLPSDPAAAEIVRVANRYQAAVRAEFDLLAAGKRAAARELDERLVDPTFDRLRELLRAEEEYEENAAATTDRLARHGSIAIILFGGLVSGVLFAVLARRRSASALVAAREAQHRENEEWLHALLGSAADVVLVLDAQGEIAYASGGVERMLGRTGGELVGTNVLTLMADADAKRLVPLGRTARGPDEAGVVEWRLQRADGNEFDGEASVVDQLANPRIQGLMVNLRDVSERKALENELRRRAFHDPLTSLPNRALLEERIAHALLRSDRDAEGIAVLFLDLDDFKDVNDSLGHEAGDQLLTVVAERLARTLRAGDTVARLGGDEFAVLLEDTDERGATDVATRLLESLEAPVVLKGKRVYVHTSVGIAVKDARHHDDVHERTARLLRDADAAMYAAKGRGKNCFVLFDPSLHARAIERLDWKAELQGALAREELLLHYQPIRSLEDGRVVGMEALLRWNHPERGLLSPAAFVPLAEELGLIVPIGRWALRAACREGAGWQEDEGGGSPGCYVSVNVSGRQLQQPGFLAEVAAALADSGLDPHRLTLEVTESSLLDDANIGQLQELHELGVRLAIDDFGTGYSSLGYLRRFPMDIIKIDRSFTRAVATSPQDARLVEGIVAMASGLQVDVVAEGIEDETQLAALRALGCTFGQGYLFAEPGDAEAAGELVRAERRRLRLRIA